MDYRILGALEVRNDGRPVVLGGEKPRALLAILLLHPNEVVPVDRLIDDLWGESPPTSALRTLQAYVSRLRKALDRDGVPSESVSGVLLTQGRGYLLRVGPAELDLDRFSDMAERGRDALGADNPQEAAELLGKALELWRGPPLADFTYDPFAQTAIHHLEELRLAALEDRIEADLAVGRAGELVGELGTLVAQHPLRERPWRQLMLALYRCGRQADALAAYQRARRELVEELGIEPGPELRSLEQAILRQDPALELKRAPFRDTPPTRAAQRRAAADSESLHKAADGGGGERKVVTALFCDLAGFAAGSGESVIVTGDDGEADPEEMRARIRPYHAGVQGAIEAFGGTVEKLIGDVIVAVFGVPRVHEDDPERAVRAGLRIVEVIADLNEEADLELQVRVGIETGEAVVALDGRAQRGERMVIGDGVNTASRLQGLAPVNGVVLGPGTYVATRDVFDFEALEPVVLKGKAKPVPVWRARSPRARLGSDVMLRLDTPLVGRQIELGILTGCFQRAVQQHTVQLVTVVGEPGVGKSRLVAELAGFVDRWPDLVRWRQGRCLSYGHGASFWALGEIVKAEAGMLETDGPDIAGSKLAEIVPGDHPEGPWLRARLRPLAGLEAPEATRQENFAAWRAFVELLAESRPSVLVFEDLHWGDDALLAFLEYLADYAEGVPLLLVATARPELFERAPAWAASARNATRINLSPLSEAETARLISSLLKQAVLPAEVQRAILDRSGGNPLYAGEFVRLLKDRGILSRSATTWRIGAGVEIPMPSGIHGLIAARLDTLSAERKRLLQDAAVIGKVFWAEAVAAMGGRDPDEVAQALHLLSRKGLVRPERRSTMAGQAEYAFHHALIRDVCYGQILRAERAERHRRAAAWVEQASGGRVEDHAAILASHTVAALELAGDGPDTPQLRAQATRYLKIAGDRSLGIDVEAAERHFAQALELATDSEAERARVLIRHADALQQRGRFADAARAYEQAIAGFRHEGDVPAMAMAMSRLDIVFAALGDPRHNSLRGEALRELEPLGPSPELVAVLAENAAMHAYGGEQDRAVELADQAISLARELGLPEQARALGFRGIARAYLGDEHGVSDMRRGLDAAKSQGLGRETAVLYYNLADVLWRIEGAGVRMRTLEEGLSFAQRHGIEEFVLSSSAEIVAALVELGSYDEAMEQARDLAPRLEETGDIEDQLLVRSSVVAVLTRQGQLEAAQRQSGPAIARAREFESLQHLVPSLGRGAVLCLAAHDPVTAHALLEELAPIGRSTPQYASVLTDAVRTALGLGDLKLARRLPEGVPSKPLLWEAALLTAQALIAEHEARHTEARDGFAAAAQRWQRLEVPWERAQALLGQGRCLIAPGRSTEAVEQLRSARGIFNLLGATPALAETDTLLERASASRLLAVPHSRPTTSSR